MKGRDISTFVQAYIDFDRGKVQLSMYLRSEHFKMEFCNPVTKLQYNDCKSYRYQSRSANGCVVHYNLVLVNCSQSQPCFRRFDSTHLPCPRYLILSKRQALKRFYSGNSYASSVQFRTSSRKSANTLMTIISASPAVVATYVHCWFILFLLFVTESKRNISTQRCTLIFIRVRVLDV